MARVNLDGKVWKDPRVKRLALRLEWSVRETVGTLAAVWDVAYDLKSPTLTAEDVDTAAETFGFAGSLVDHRLATRAPDDRIVRLAGVTERILYLLAQGKRGRDGGRAKARATAKQTLSKRQSERKPCPGLPLSPSPSPSLALTPDLDPGTKRSTGGLAKPADSQPSKSRSKPGDPTAAELASATEVLSRLTIRNGVAYRGSRKHVALIVSRLRDGATEWDLRLVVGYCAEELGWGEDPKMRKYLRPETLFGPETIERYLDAARTWGRKLEAPQPKETPVVIGTGGALDMSGDEPVWWATEAAS